MERAREFLEGLTHEMRCYEETPDQWKARFERERAADQARREWAARHDQGGVVA